MIHPHTEVRFISEEVGYGVVATRAIPKGTITWVQDDLDKQYTPEEVKKMSPISQEMMEKYSFRNNKGNFVLCWDTSKYVNHSFKSNCLSTPYEFEIAVRDIAEGEELTDDYGYLNITHPFKAKDEGTRRTTVYPDDLVNFHEKWDEQLRDAMRYFEEVNQPMKQWLSAKTLEKLKPVLKGEVALDSIFKLYYPH